VRVGVQVVISGCLAPYSVKKGGFLNRISQDGGGRWGGTFLRVGE
jgi:hypothetical protein